MHDNVFDRYHSRESSLHRLDPRVKILATIFFILSNVLLPDGAWLAFGLAWGSILLVNVLADLGLTFSLRKSLITIPFSLAAFTVLFSIPGQAWVTLHLGSLNLVITEAGLLRFSSILLRAWLSVQAAILLVATTRFPDLLHALEHLHLPKILVTITAFLYRYLFVLSDEVLRLLRARQARSASLPGLPAGGHLTWRARVTGNMVGQLFLRSYERSDRIYNAMLSRGYTGQVRTLNIHVIRSRDWLFILLVGLVITFLQIISRLS